MSTDNTNIAKTLQPCPGISGTVSAIASKSHAHRLLIARKISELQGGALEGGVEIPAFSDDIEATMACISQRDKNTPYLECGESGSTLRFMLPVVMALKDSATFLGTGRLPDRPRGHRGAVRRQWRQHPQGHPARDRQRDQRQHRLRS